MLIELSWQRFWLCRQSKNTIVLQAEAAKQVITPIDEKNMCTDCFVRAAFLSCARKHGAKNTIVIHEASNKTDDNADYCTLTALPWQALLYCRFFQRATLYKKTSSLPRVNVVLRQKLRCFSDIILIFSAFHVLAQKSCCRFGKF